MLSERRSVKKINESASGVNIPLPNCNLYVKGWGKDKNGNSRIIVGLPNDKGYSIQTNGVLPNTHSIIRMAGKSLGDAELLQISSEVIPYIKQSGPATVKARLKTWK